MTLLDSNGTDDSMSVVQLVADDEEDAETRP